MFEFKEFDWYRNNDIADYIKGIFILYNTAGMSKKKSISKSQV